MRRVPFNPEDDSVSISPEVKMLAKTWIADQKAKGDTSIPSLANLINLLLLEYLLERTHDPELKSIVEAVRKSARNVAARSNSGFSYNSSLILF
jgi:hypothetical protein